MLDILGEKKGSGKEAYIEAVWLLDQRLPRNISKQCEFQVLKKRCQKLGTLKLVVKLTPEQLSASQQHYKFKHSIFESNRITEHKDEVPLDGVLRD